MTGAQGDQHVTTRRKTAEPIEVCLSQPYLEVTCRIVFRDGSAVAVGVDSLSIAGAQREMTTWLMEQGYEPAGRWNAGGGTGHETARLFRRADRQVPAAVFAALRPLMPTAPRQETGPRPARGPAPRSASRPRRAGPREPGTGGGPGPGLSRQAAEAELRAWAHAYLRRNEVIRAADAAGISVGRIHEVTGIERTSILRILGSPPGRRGQRPPEA
jgi:hypothetical protein